MNREVLQFRFAEIFIRELMGAGPRSSGAPKANLLLSHRVEGKDIFKACDARYMLE